MTLLRAITDTEAHRILTRDLTGTEACDQVAKDCALLRSCAWSLTDGVRPVHILRLLNLATTLHLLGEMARAQLKQALEELSECGDLAELSGGQWLPAPTREVGLETVDDIRLLVGGFPTSLLSFEHASTIEHAGPYRKLKGGTLSKELGLASQDLGAWMGHVPDDLSEWTQSILRGEYEPFRPIGRPIEVYAPELFPASKPQLQRWVDRADRLAGTYLSREELPFGGRRYLAVEIVKGQISKIRAMPQADIRRLMYGLDQAAEKPVMVEEILGRNETTFVLRSELPQAEQRLFAVLGRLVVPETKYYPRNWTFRQEHVVEIKCRLARLGVGTFRRAHR